MIRNKLIVLAVLSSLVLTGCEGDAKIASKNVSKDADNFEVLRRVVFYNAIRGEYILEMTGYCSIYADSADRQLEAICKTGKDKYQKHFLGYSDNVTYTVEQLDHTPASKYHYKIIFKPESILPFQNVEVR